MNAMRKTALVLALGFSIGSLAHARDAAFARHGGGFLLTAPASAAAWDLRVAGPNNFVFEATFLAGEAIEVGPKNLQRAWEDGAYRYELTPVAGMAKRGEAQAGGGNAVATVSGSSGVFSVQGGRIVANDAVESSAKRVQDGFGLQDQVIPDDLIVQGSGCFGFDCVNNESFGFDTIRLKENNLRIKFEDTSTGAFPSNDWQLTANDSASGGANKFSIEDITGAKVPFTVTAGAVTNSLFVDSIGRVGFGTATPALKLHMNQSDTPAVRFEQNNSGGFTAQTWDVAGNEANFFVRDVTSGSRLPFRIRPGAPTSSIDIGASGDVGIGTASPSEDLHVFGNDGGTKFLVQEDSATSAPREMLELRNNGTTVMIFDDTSVAQRWANGSNGPNFVMNEQANPGVEFTLSNTGNLIITGTLTQGSDRNRKENFQQLDPQQILEKVMKLPVTRWNFKEDGIPHIGPMAQDFAALFEVGNDDKRIAPIDEAGVALLAIQALNTRLDDKDREIAALRAELSEAGSRIEQQQVQLSALRDQQDRIATLEAVVARLIREDSAPVLTQTAGGSR